MEVEDQDFADIQYVNEYNLIDGEWFIGTGMSDGMCNSHIHPALALVFSRSFSLFVLSHAVFYVSVSTVLGFSVFQAFRSFQKFVLVTVRAFGPGFRTGLSVL